MKKWKDRPNSDGYWYCGTSDAVWIEEVIDERGALRIDGEESVDDYMKMYPTTKWAKVPDPPDWE